MGRIPTGIRKYEIKKLKPSHIEILQRLVNGEKPKDIARDLGISTQTISNVRNSRVAIEMLEVMEAKMDNEIRLALSVIPYLLNLVVFVICLGSK